MPPEPSGTALKAACALLYAGGMRGTGFLISVERLLACNHVVQQAGETLIQVRFSHGCYEAHVELVDAQHDCALLRLTKPVPASDAQPLVIATAQVQKNDEWEGYGFPAATEQAGLLVDGRIQDPLGQDRTLRPALVLQSASVTAGSELGGFSGSPVLAKGQVIGQMRSIIPDQSGGAQMAVVYACPAGILADLARRRLGAKAFSAPNPYRGLSSFQPADAHLFFGRDKLTEKLVQLFRRLYETTGERRLLAVFGPSGSGKSSVALAGLVPALQTQPVPGPAPLRIVQCKPGDRPLESLARALVPLLPPEHTVLPASRVLAIEALLHNPSPRGEGLRRFAADFPDISAAPLVVVVDQFEEVYTLCQDPEQRDFFVENLLHAASDSSRSVSIVLTLRSDFLAETQRHHLELNRLIAEQGLLVPALSPDELRDAIARPAQLAGQPLDPATMDLLLSEAKGNQYALPLLEFALTQIWEGMERGQEPSTTLHHLGGVGGALAGQAHKIYDALSKPAQDTARRALVRMVQMGEGTRDTRRRASIRELCGHGQTEADVLAVLRHFSTETARLVTLSEAGAEVTHEALFDHWAQLRKWIDESREDRRFYDRVAEAVRLWIEGGRHAGRLWRSPDLDLLHKFSLEHAAEMSSEQVRFMEASLLLRTQEQRTERAHRRLRWFTMTVTVVLPVLALATWTTMAQKDRVLRAFMEVDKSRKAAEHEQIRAQQAQIEALKQKDAAVEAERKSVVYALRAKEAELKLKEVLAHDQCKTKIKNLR